MKTNLLLVVLMLFASCNPVRSNRGGAPALKLMEGLEIENPLGYHFTDDSCTTGPHTFNSKQELCIGLQDDTLNNSCAVNERLKRFGKDCEEKLGFKWMESAQCEAMVLKKNVDIDVVPQAADILSKNVFCAGRMEAFGWSKVSRVSTDAVILNDIVLRFSVEAPAIENGDYKVSWNLTQKDGQDYGENFENNLASISQGAIFGREEQLRIVCHVSPGCRKN